MEQRGQQAQVFRQQGREQDPHQHAPMLEKMHPLQEKTPPLLLPQQTTAVPLLLLQE
jgi:hypothetical protein